jgi:hypothetical protein
MFAEWTVHGSGTQNPIPTNRKQEPRTAIIETSRMLYFARIKPQCLSSRGHFYYYYYSLHNSWVH